MLTGILQPLKYPFHAHSTCPMRILRCPLTISRSFTFGLLHDVVCPPMYQSSPSQVSMVDVFLFNQFCFTFARNCTSIRPKGATGLVMRPHTIRRLVNTRRRRRQSVRLLSAFLKIVRYGFKANSKERVSIVVGAIGSVLLLFRAFKPPVSCSTTARCASPRLGLFFSLTSCDAITIMQALTLRPLFNLWLLPSLSHHIARESVASDGDDHARVPTPSNRMFHAVHLHESSNFRGQ